MVDKKAVLVLFVLAVLAGESDTCTAPDGTINHRPVAVIDVR